jgi:hypothetical protein
MISRRDIGNQSLLRRPIRLGQTEVRKMPVKNCDHNLRLVLTTLDRFQLEPAEDPIRNLEMPSSTLFGDRRTSSPTSGCLSS